MFSEQASSYRRVRIWFYGDLLASAKGPDRSSGQVKTRVDLSQWRQLKRLAIANSVSRERDFVQSH